MPDRESAGEPVDTAADLTPAAAGIDLGGTQVKFVVVNCAGVILRRILVPTHDGDPGAGAVSWIEAIPQLAKEHAAGLPLGVSAPGLVAADGRSIACMPGRMAGLQRLEWTSALAWPSVIPVLNDAHASLLGERWCGAAQGLSECCMFTLGTGVGGAALVNGRLVKGRLGRAGHFGHVSLDIYGAPSITGTPGALEDFIGNHNIRQRSAGAFESTHALVAAYQAGDLKAEEIWLRSVRALACALVGCMNSFDPEAIIIGGGIAAAGASLFAPLDRFLQEFEWRPDGTRTPIVPARLGEWAGAIGAARAALDLHGA